MSISTSQTNICAKHSMKPRSFWAKLDAMLTVRRQRRHLLDLDDHMLNDIGISRSEAVQESLKSSWDAPGYWLR
ncbi:DUF1127 domain-containing protein [Yoonia sp. GPGPB17]|uniref:DUF1127 domain-containing protein n=1 Tax=Yoonia sp. GPGPB17 TaxID=3026147 RepID=UPI0030BCB00F